MLPFKRRLFYVLRSYYSPLGIIIQAVHQFLISIAIGDNFSIIFVTIWLTVKIKHLQRLIVAVLLITCVSHIEIKLSANKTNDLIYFTFCDDICYAYPFWWSETKFPE